MSVELRFPCKNFLTQLTLMSLFLHVLPQMLLQVPFGSELLVAVQDAADVLEILVCLFVLGE